LIFFDASFQKGLSILENVFYSFSIIRKRKRKSTTLNALYKTKIVLSAALLRFNYCSFRYLCYPNELFWTEEGRFSWRYVDGKAGYATFKVKDAVTKKEITINNSHFLTTFQENKWLSNLISF
jgi:hypothetical protein